jgi:hypothetical protein
VIEEKEEIWIAEVVEIGEMTEEVAAAVKEEAAAVQEVVVDKVGEVEDLAVWEEVLDQVVVVEVVVVEEQAVVAEEEDKLGIKTKLKTRN